MAVCDLEALKQQASDNGFLSIAENNPNLARGVEVKLWQELAGDDSTLGELIDAANANCFNCVTDSPTMSNAVMLQLLCNITNP